MNDTEWRQQLKPGDEVVIRGYRFDSFAQVSRRTKTQIIVSQTALAGHSYEVRFNAKTGYRVGQTGYSRSWLAEPTKEIKEAAELRTLQLRARNIIERIQMPKTITEVETLIAAIRPFCYKEEK